MKFTVTIPDDIFGEVTQVLVRGSDGITRRVQGQQLKVEPAEVYVDVEQVVEPDWRIIEILHGTEYAVATRDAWLNAQVAASLADEKGSDPEVLK